NPDGFEFLIPPKKSFESPEAVFTYGAKGFNSMSQNMHLFVREHIVRGTWKNKARPVLLNSWEANYFDISEDKLIKLAKAGAKLGIELFVMDDGWFGKRNDDYRALGDWYPNTEKLPNGLKDLVDKIKSFGLDFGIWVEPEMVNVDSDLYRKHPEWVMQVEGQEHSQGRNQRVLDLSNPEVQDYIIETMTKVFSSAEISYVKWDMNRIFSDVYSKYLPPQLQGEVFHRYVLGLYRCMEELTSRFPHILFEGCSGGGNRFDLGILSYFPQIWASDNTDAISRIDIQNGYSYGYPMSTIGAHVSDCPNHQTKRETPLNTRFQIAAFGLCGYEYNFCKLSQDILDEIVKQIRVYKLLRNVLQAVRFYRGDYGNITQWTCVSQDGKKAIGLIVQKLAQANVQYHCYKAKGLNEEDKYTFSNLIRLNSGEVICFDKEKLETKSSGAVLMNSGVKLNQAYSGTGENENTRQFSDFSTRMYFMEAI
ncbi:MAG: alpha-galactosidase, partial [Enterococcus sp.]|nr:alpha-galactosidase [Enterococcus sp.]